MAQCSAFTNKVAGVPGKMAELEVGGMPPTPPDRCSGRIYPTFLFWTWDSVEDLQRGLDGRLRLILVHYGSSRTSTVAGSRAHAPGIARHTVCRSQGGHQTLCLPNTSDLCFAHRLLRWVPEEQTKRWAAIVPRPIITDPPLPPRQLKLLRGI